MKKGLLTLLVLTSMSPAFAARQAVIIGGKSFQADLSMRLRNMPGMETRETSNIDDGDANLIINQDLSEMWMKVIHDMTLNLPQLKSTTAPTLNLFESQKDIFINQVEVEEIVDRDLNKRKVYTAYAWVSKNCYVSVQAYSDQENLKTQQVLIRKGEVLAAYRGFDSHYTDVNAKQDFRLELVTPGHLNARNLTCYKPVGPDSSVQDLINATEAYFKVAP